MRLRTWRIIGAAALSALLLGLVLLLPLEGERVGGRWVAEWWGARLLCPLNGLANHGAPWGVVVALNWATILIWCGGIGTVASWMIVRPRKH